MYSDKSVAELKTNADHDPNAQFLIGMHYSEGTGGAVQDWNQALEWFLKAAENGHLVAQYLMYRYYSLKCHISPKDNTKLIEQCICIAWLNYAWIEILRKNYPQLYNRMIHRDINVDEFLEMPEIQAVWEKVNDLLNG